MWRNSQRLRILSQRFQLSRCLVPATRTNGHLKNTCSEHLHCFMSFRLYSSEAVVSAPSESSSASPAITESAASTNTAPSASAPTQGELPLSFVLAQLSDARWTAGQVRTMIQNLLHAMNLLPADMQFTPSSHAKIAFPLQKDPTSPLTPAQTLREADWESLLSACQLANDSLMFEIVWKSMFDTYSTLQHASAPYMPTTLMRLCRMNILLAKGEINEVSSTFQQWIQQAKEEQLKRQEQENAQPSEEVKRSPLRVFHPPILAYNIQLKALLQRNDVDVSKQCLELLNEIKLYNESLKEQESEEETAAALKSKKKKQPQPTPTLTPTELKDSKSTQKARLKPIEPQHFTFHLILQSLLQAATNTKASSANVPSLTSILQQLSSILLEMDTQFTLVPDSTSLIQSMQIVRQVYKSLHQMQLALQQQKQTTTATASTAAAIIAQQKTLTVLQNACTDRLKQIWTSSEQLGSTLAQCAEESPATANRPNLSDPLHFIAPRVLNSYFDLLLLDGSNWAMAQLFTLLGALQQQRVAFLLPTNLCERVLDKSRSISREYVPPPAALVAQSSTTLQHQRQQQQLDEDDVTLLKQEWRKAQKELIRQQQLAADGALQILKYFNTHEENDRRSWLKSQQQQQAGNAADLKALHSFATVPPAFSLSFAHYVNVFEILGNTGRLDEFAKLWSHFLAQQQAKASQQPPKDDAAQQANPKNGELEWMRRTGLEVMVRSALRLEPQFTPTSSATSSTSKVGASEKNPATAIAFQILEFFTPTTPHKDYSKAVTFLSPRTVTMFQRSLLASDMLDEFELLLTAQKEADAARIKSDKTSSEGAQALKTEK